MVRAIIIGFGCMGCLTYKYLLERGASVVAVFNRKSHVGEDAGEYAAIGNTGLTIQPVDKLEQTLEAEKVDIALVLNASLMKEVESLITTCVTKGIDCFTIAEDLLYPYGTESLKEPARRLDILAKNHGATIIGGGFNDTLMCWLVPLLSSAAHNLSEIEITCIIDIDQYMQGTPGFSQALFPTLFGMGKTLEEFEAHFKPMNEDPNIELGRIAGTIAQWICKYFGWKIETHRQYFEPTTAKSKVFSKGLQANIPAGHVTGCNEITITTTRDGKKLKVNMISRSFSDGEEDILKVKIRGDPPLTCVIQPGHVAEFTCTSCINRIPDVLQAEPGLVISTDLPPPKYVDDLSFSVKK